MTDQQHDNHGTEEISDKPAESRFDRRRFIRSAAIAAPLLATVKSPKVWATNGYDGLAGCTASTLSSLNTSSPHIDCQGTPISPGGWHSVYDDCDKDNWKSWVAKAIQNAGYGSTASFNSIFLSSSAVTYVTYNGWVAEFDSSASDDPSLRDCLPNGHGNSGLTGYSTCYKFYPQGYSSNEDCVFGFDIAQGQVTGAGSKSNKPHTFIVAGLLNSLFAPGTISYSYHGDTSLIFEVQEAIRAVLMNVISDLVSSGVFNSASGTCSSLPNNFIDKYPLESLKASVDQW